jgi:hypothetical protein
MNGVPEWVWWVLTIALGIIAAVFTTLALWALWIDHT